MWITVASWNIEKNGKSSTLDKQSKVSGFLDACVTQYKVALIFLCEVHHAQETNYKSFLEKVYPSYAVHVEPGGQSNAYVLLFRKDILAEFFYCKLFALNRSVMVCRFNNDLCVGLAHFKSGQSGLTKSQIEGAASGLEGMSGGRWALLGDMNWEFTNQSQPTLPAKSQSLLCMSPTHKTQASGSTSTLDWCIVGPKTTAVAGWVTQEMGTGSEILYPAESMFPEGMYDMDGPDHKPIVFSFVS